MREFKFVITDPEGMHIRPAGIFVKKAEGFKSNVTIERGHREADAKRIMRVMALGIGCGEEITVRCEGSDENEAIAELEKFFKENM